MAELLRLFFGLPEADVLELRNNAVALIKEGKTTMNYSIGGNSAGKMFPMPPKEVLFEANAALRHINPETYGKRITRFKADFSGITLA